VSWISSRLGLSMVSRAEKGRDDSQRLSIIAKTVRGNTALAHLFSLGHGWGIIVG
jgi:hypothetical protein